MDALNGFYPRYFCLSTDIAASQRPLPSLVSYGLEFISTYPLLSVKSEIQVLSSNLKWCFLQPYSVAFHLFHDKNKSFQWHAR